MGFGIFMHREDSIYKDSPSERYQFPKNYLSRAKECDWIIYLEPSKVKDSRGYFAVAKIDKIISDSSFDGMYYALIEAGTYLDFPNNVPFNGPLGVVEKGVLNAEGKNSGRAQAAIRPLSAEDFNRIIGLGLTEQDDFYPREGDPISSMLLEERSPFIFEEEKTIISTLLNRKVRDRAFRTKVINAYDCRCAFTGIRLINGGGRAEVQAAHIKPVSENGPDIVSNGIALSGTAHWMFDRGLISLSDNLDILISRQYNDPTSIESMLMPDRKMIRPSRDLDRPHPAFLAWHRDNYFKH